MAAGNDRLFEALCETVGRPELASDPRFVSNAARTENHPALKAALDEAFATRAKAEWTRALEAAGVPCGPIQDVGQVVEDPQVLARNMLIESLLPQGESIRMAGNPIKLSGFADPETRRAAPDLDADRERILAELREGSA